MSKNTTSYLKIVPSIAWAFFIMVVCLIPHDKLPEAHFQREDLVIHILAYAIWSILICYGLYHLQKKMSWRALVSLWAIMALYGLAIEVLQAILPIRRTFSVEDFLFNSAGAAVIFFQNKLNGLFLRWNL